MVRNNERTVNEGLRGRVRERGQDRVLKSNARLGVGRGGTGDLSDAGCELSARNVEQRRVQVLAWISVPKHGARPEACRYRTLRLGVEDNLKGK